MIHKKYCVRCKATEGLMPNPYAKYIKKNGDAVGAYLCRECNRKRTSKYRHTVAGALARKRANRNAYLKRPHAQAARAKLNYFIAKGGMIRPEVCSDCSEISNNIEGHHPDYDKPLEVIWLCKVCHSRKHQMIALEKR